MQENSIFQPDPINQSADILIVDDAPQDLKLLANMLSRSGYSVRVAHNGEIAIASIEREIPDLILLDIRMPGMDGFEVCRRLKSMEATRELPVIFISALQEPSDKIQAFEAGGLDYIIKPFNQAEVLARVRNHLGMRKMRQRLESEALRRAAQLQKSKRALKLISRSNRILMRATDETNLLRRICQAVVEVGGFAFSWAGCPDANDDGHLVMVALEAAESAREHPLAVALRTENIPGLCTSTLEAFQSAKAIFIEDLSAHEAAECKVGRAALQTGLTCCAALPLAFDGKIYGVLGVFGDNPEVFEPNEKELLKELSQDVAYGIRTLRARARHKRAEKALAESEQRYRQLFEKAGEAVFLIEARDPGNSRIVQANQAAAEMHGYTVDELIGMPIIKLDSPEAAREFPERHKRLQAGEWIHQELSHLKKDGTIFTTEVSVGIVDIGDQKYILAFYRDISDRKRIEAENAELEAQVRQANKMEAIGTLASGIAHDFNNILSAASGYTELSIPLVPPGSILCSNLQKIQQANKRAAELVRHILTLSREKESAVQVLQPKLIIQEAIKLLRASLPATIEIRQWIDSSAYIMGDAAQVHQIIMNLCVNAGHAMEESGGVLTISLTDEELDAQRIGPQSNLSPGPYVMLTVSDTGHGIPEDIIEKIFDPYFTTKSQGKGTGLGLAVVNGIVNSYRGTITAESKVGEGARFNLLLPAVVAEQGAKVETGQPIPRGSERILFIDDEPALVEIGQQLLQLLGYHVTTRTSSAQALDLYRENPAAFDLLISDYTMPKMTGAQLARFVREINPDMPVILMSGLEVANLEAEAGLAGVSGCLCKPINIKEIAIMVRELLDGNGRRSKERG